MIFWGLILLSQEPRDPHDRTKVPFFFLSFMANVSLILNFKRIFIVLSLIWDIDTVDFFQLIGIKFYYYIVILKFNDNLKKETLIFKKKLLTKD